MRPVTRRIPILALLLLAGFSACGEDGRPPFTGGLRDLLSFPPDRIIHQAGRLKADPERQWKEHGLSGWKQSTVNRGSWSFVWSNEKTAKLNLPACEPRDRTLALCMLLPSVPPWERGEPGAVLRLNGIKVGEVMLAYTPETYRISTPREAWRRGDNVLEIEVDRLHRLGPDDFAGIGLAEIEYDTPILVETDPGRRLLKLKHQTCATYLIEQPCDTELEVAGLAEGPGTLEAAFSFQDPLIGLAAKAEPGRERLPNRESRIEGRILLPRREGAILRMELTWTAGDASTGLAFEKLQLRERRPVRRPPIILVSIDTLAARHLSLYGYPRKTSPRLDLLAKEAVVFEQCMSNATWTLPSYLSLMTGLYPGAHPPQVRAAERILPAAGRHDAGGLSGRDSWGVWSVPSHRWTLAEMLRAAGYRTAGFTDHFFVSERYRFEQGFERFRSQSNAGAARVLPPALKWLGEIDAGQPFFLFLHVFNVHGPYRPGDASRGRFAKDGAADDATRTAAAGGVLNAFRVIPDYISKDFIPGGQAPERIPTAPVSAAYDEEILDVDAALGAFFDDLEALGILDSAMVIVNADHGESMVDHDYYFGHGVLYEEVTRVPLIIRMPRGEGGGARLSEPVQTVDLYATIRDLLGLDPEAAGCQGRSLVPLLQGESLPQRPCFCETGIMRQAAVLLDGWKLIETFPSELSSPATMVTHPRVPAGWLKEHAPELMGHGLTPERYARIFPGDDGAGGGEKLRDLKRLLKGPFHELYYLPEDPRETRNLAEARPDQVKTLLQHLRAYQRMNEEQRRRAATASTDAAPPRLSDADLERLRQLGYVEGR